VTQLGGDFTTVFFYMVIFPAISSVANLTGAARRIGRKKYGLPPIQ
jgi:hypothetical protein